MKYGWSEIIYYIKYEFMWSHLSNLWSISLWYIGIISTLIWTLIIFSTFTLIWTLIIYFKWNCINGQNSGKHDIAQLIAWTQHCLRDCGIWRFVFQRSDESSQTGNGRHSNDVYLNTTLYNPINHSYDVYLMGKETTLHNPINLH